MKKTYVRNHENNIHEDIALYKEELRISKELDKSFSTLTKMVMTLTNKPYQKIQTKTIKNGLNIIKNVPCNIDGVLNEETLELIEWIYKEMYIQRKKEVDFNEMKNSYYKKEQSTTKKIQKSISNTIFSNY